MPATAGNGKGRMLSPVVRRLAAENNLDLARISGSGGGGRIMREDVLAALAGPFAGQDRGAARRDPPGGRAQAAPDANATRWSRCRGSGW